MYRRPDPYDEALRLRYAEEDAQRDLEPEFHPNPGRNPYEIDHDPAEDRYRAWIRSEDPSRDSPYPPGSMGRK